MRSIDMLFDVGANVGQFAQGLRQAGYRGRIVSFEPGSDAHRGLVANAAADAGWTVAPRMALGAETSEVVLNVAPYSEANSVLPIRSLHTEILPGSAYTDSEAVHCGRLDDVASEYLRSGDRALLKLDVQGFEKQVLEGAEELLRQCSGVYLELSTVPLYEGQALIDDVLGHLYTRGFRLWWIKPGFIDPSNGRLLQMDGLLFR
ncbi:MAG: FkbM family methyltransferase [Acidobacteriia bacterium]|nr:FkbM family methyltransferase [Terriglobia bacterium]